MRKVDRARRIITTRETDILVRILRQGVESGEFSIDNIPLRAVVITHAIQGLDVPYIRESLIDQGVDKKTMVRYVGDMILYGIKKRD